MKIVVKQQINKFNSFDFGMKSIDKNHHSGVHTQTHFPSTRRRSVRSGSIFYHHHLAMLTDAVLFVLFENVKLLLAVSATEQFCPGMKPLVQPEVPIPNEALVAHLAPERLNAAMYRLLVSLQIRLMGVRSAAALVRTFVLPFAVMHLRYSEVPPKSLLIAELVPFARRLARFALVCSGLVVNAPVVPKILLAFELLLADGAHIVARLVMSLLLVAL